MIGDELSRRNLEVIGKERGEVGCHCGIIPIVRAERIWEKVCVFFYEVEECLDGKSVFEVLFMSFQLYELREYGKRYVCVFL